MDSRELGRRQSSNRLSMRIGISIDLLLRGDFVLSDRESPRPLAARAYSNVCPGQSIAYCRASLRQIQGYIAEINAFGQIRWEGLEYRLFASKDPCRSRIFWHPLASEGLKLLSRCYPCNERIRNPLSQFNVDTNPSVYAWCKCGSND